MCSQWPSEVISPTMPNWRTRSYSLSTILENAQVRGLEAKLEPLIKREKHSSLVAAGHWDDNHEKQKCLTLFGMSALFVGVQNILAIIGIPVPWQRKRCICGTSVSTHYFKSSQDFLNCRVLHLYQHVHYLYCRAQCLCFQCKTQNL